MQKKQNPNPKMYNPPKYVKTHSRSRTLVIKYVLAFRKYLNSSILIGKITAKEFPIFPSYILYTRCCPYSAEK